MKNSLQRKCLIGIVILFIGASTMPIMSTEQVNTIYEKSDLTGQPFWEDDFDNYTLGQFLDGTPDDGGWKGWDNDPQFGAYVSDTQNRSTPHSVEIAWFTSVAADIVHEFSGVNQGNWVFTAWQYIPGDFSGETNFLLLNTYEDGGPHQNPHWSNALTFSSITDTVYTWQQTSSLPLIYDEWVEIRIEISFPQDLQWIYYGDELLESKSWTAGIEPGGALNLACVDLYAGSVLSTSVYYDDLSLEGDVTPQPELSIEDIAGGFGVSAVIKNTGEGNATDVEWSITLDGGLIILGKETKGTITTIPAGDEETIKSGLIFGIGKPTITITAECFEGASDEETASGLVILFFVLGVT
jgi:hypothetical protein